MATISRIGFGQVEPNHLSAQRNGQIYGQLPAAADITVLENGQFVKYDYANGACNFTGAGEWMLVFNEVKLYDDFWRESYKDFAMKKTSYDKGEMTPRVLKTMPGDIFTTNCLEGANTDGKAEFVGTEDLAVGKILKINANGYLSLNGESDIEFQIVKVYTMPDGQAAVKVMRTK
jgi:hypothetical protein